MSRRRKRSRSLEERVPDEPANSALGVNPRKGWANEGETEAKGSWPAEFSQGVALRRSVMARGKGEEENEEEDPAGK